MKKITRVSATNLASHAFCPRQAYFERNMPEKLLRSLTFDNPHAQRLHQEALEGAARRKHEGLKAHKKVESDLKDSRCFVATWAYGPDHEVTIRLRKFRDQVLMPSFCGRQSVRLYYFLSPWAVRLLRNNQKAKIVSQKILSKIVQFLGD